MKKRDHYKTLGVDADASPNDVKRAYRSKARKHHPDKGGDAKEFAEVANAYEVLSDPQRKQLYDATGSDKTEDPIELEVENVLRNAFAAALDADDNMPIVEFVRDGLKRVTLRFPEQVKQLTQRKKKLAKKRKSVTSKAAVNLVHQLIDRELQSIEEAFAMIERAKLLNKLCLETLDQYSEEFESPAPNTFRIRFNGEYYEGRGTFDL